MSAAAADISLQGLHNFRLTGIRVFLKESHATDDHSGSAIRALERAVIEKSLLHGMKLPVLLESFDGNDGFFRRVADRKLAGAPRRAIQQNCTCAALTLAAAVFRSGETKFFSQRKEQTCVRVRFEDATCSVYLYVDWPGHLLLETPRAIGERLLGNSLLSR
jgi:hypothetical protein